MAARRQIATAIANQYQWDRQRFQMSLMLRGSSLLGAVWEILLLVSIFKRWFYCCLALYLVVRAMMEAAREAIEIQVELALKVLPLTVDSLMRFSLGVT